MAKVIHKCTGISSSKTYQQSLIVSEASKIFRHSQGNFYGTLRNANYISNNLSGYKNDQLFEGLNHIGISCIVLHLPVEPTESFRVVVPNGHTTHWSYSPLFVQLTVNMTPTVLQPIGPTVPTHEIPYDCQPSKCKRTMVLMKMQLQQLQLLFFVEFTQSTPER